MSQIVKDAIAADVAELERVTSTPEEPFGFGRDLSCVNDIDANASEVDPFSVRAIGEALVRRLTTPRGSLPDDPDYGKDLRAALNRGLTTSEINATAGDVRAEVTKDDRVDEAQVTLTPSPQGTSMKVRIRVTPVDPNVGGFALTLAVTSADVVLEAFE